MVKTGQLGTTTSLLTLSHPCYVTLGVVSYIIIYTVTVLLHFMQPATCIIYLVLM